MNKKLLVLCLVLVFALTAVVGCGQKAPQTIKIGHAVALTGDSAMWGQAEKMPWIWR